MMKYVINILIVLLGVISMSLSLENMVGTADLQKHYVLTSDSYLNQKDVQRNLNAYKIDNDDVSIFQVQVHLVQDGEKEQQAILTDDECLIKYRELTTIEPIFEGSIDIYFDDQKVYTLNLSDYHKIEREGPTTRTLHSETVDVEGYLFAIYKDDIKKVSIVPNLAVKKEDNKEKSIYICSEILNVVSRGEEKITMMSEMFSLGTTSPWVNLFQFSEKYVVNGKKIPKSMTHLIVQ